MTARYTPHVPLLLFDSSRSLNQLSAERPSDSRRAVFVAIGFCTNSAQDYAIAFLSAVRSFESSGPGWQTPGAPLRDWIRPIYRITRVANSQHTAHLSTSMDSQVPPPVPPKDTPQKTRTDADWPPMALASASKRKREASDDSAYFTRDGLLEVDASDTHTPKRSRSRISHSDGHNSDEETPRNKRSIRRKKASNNLSTLNLRHAAAQQPTIPSPSRESKFLEGSLTDKPSDKPPSMFTRVTRSENSNPSLVDQLMTDYHDGMVDESVTTQQRRDAPTAEPSKNESGVFFRFGRSFANFHPVSLWNRMWNETKEELTRQNMLELERKARQKAEAEAKYAEMKKGGQFGFSVVRGSVETPTPRDSAVVIESGRPSHDHDRVGSYGSQLAAVQDDVDGHSGAEGSATGHKTLKSFRSRLHLKKPSLTNIKNGLKRVRSDLDLGAAATRESSSSASPTKAEFPSLQKSHSKYDLKKHTRLSRRVSDLESKLQKARQELNEAINEASPMPKIGNRHQRFVPTETIKRPKFVPGALPSLPSERVLFPEGFNSGDQEGDKSAASEPPNAFDLSEDEETVKAHVKRPYPTRATSLFGQSDDYIHPSDNQRFDNEPVEPIQSDIVTEHSDNFSTMDPNTIINLTSAEVVEPAAPQYESLDAKLKALESSVKTAKKSTKSKKRSAAAADDNKAFKPEDDDGDDAEWSEATPKKKRKSNGKSNTSPNTKKSSKIPKPKVEAKASKKAGSITDSSPHAQKTTRKTLVIEETVESNDDAEGGASAELDELAPVRTSMDSQGMQLEPVYEEEEETATIPIKDAPSKPTAQSTPARYGRSAVRSRSSSPQKRTASAVQAGAEEMIITRAAEAARRGRSVSPFRFQHNQSPSRGDGDVIAVPGEKDGAKLRKGIANDSTEHQKGFQWPDDVF